uniref:Oxidoreductase OpS5-like n=1 Tax=Crassostrea virginica TaxID=6565 RepID=A0A8B8CYX3_CRAVI|nr:oxidoreductase OpS5-like [Crassostrea virginica]
MMQIKVLLCTLLMSGIFCNHMYEDYKNHPCIRKCDSHFPRTCAYNFTVEYYHTLSKACFDCPFNATDCDRPHCVAADGTRRGIITVNRMVPGPGIHICYGDTVVVNVINKLEGADGVSIHWHGLHQRNTPHMDGVSMLTQCAIHAHSSFQYKFKPDFPGTYFWHSHSGTQRMDGLFGPLVIRQEDAAEPHLGFYDHDLPEHAILINDWLVELSINRFANHHHAGGDNKPASMLINGKGTFQRFTNQGNETTFTPHEVLTVEHGKRYRIRLISNGLLNCPIQFSVDNHNLTIIATDGFPVKPMTVESLNVFAGERFDIVIAATQPVGSYWIRTRGEADCIVKRAHQEAILRYQGSNNSLPQQDIGFEAGRRTGKKLNPWNKAETDDLIPVSQLVSLHANDDALTETPDKTIYMSMDFNKIDNYHFHDPLLYPISAVERSKHLYLPQINYISNMLPPAPPLTQYKDIPQELFCNSRSVGGNCSSEFCECVHVEKVDLGDVVEFVLVDEGKTFDANHPMHLHGYSYRVVGMGKVSRSTTLQEVKDLDAAGNITRNLNSSVIKDTVTVPDGGYTIVRIHATNPGFWFFHCHIDFHAEIGMGLILQVGEIHQMPKPPHKFPMCGNWKYTTPATEDEDERETVCPTSSAGSVGFSVSLTVFTFLFFVICR